MKMDSFPFVPEDHGNFSFEHSIYKNGYSLVAGTDEVGRGPLAGPVIAAAVVLPKNCDHHIFEDSKRLSHKKRESLHQHLLELDSLIGIGTVSETVIDQINILQASLLAMKLAVEDIANQVSKPDFLLVDGKFEIPDQIDQLALIKGESKSASIAAASIVAKVTRDRVMQDLHKKFPQYGFNTNSGYPTKVHREAIKEFGPCPYHRRSFKGVKEYVTVS